VTSPVNVLVPARFRRPPLVLVVLKVRASPTVKLPPLPSNCSAAVLLTVVPAAVEPSAVLLATIRTLTNELLVILRLVEPVPVPVPVYQSRGAAPEAVAIHQTHTRSRPARGLLTI